MKVLIVDDHSYNRELLKFVLEDHGYDYVIATNGLEAVEAVTNDPDIDIVLMDVNMPVMDGYESTRQIKALVAERFMAIIFVTALDDDETLAKCLSVGGDDFIPKPVNELVLTAKLQAHQRTIEFHRALEKSNAELQYHQRLMDREHSIVEHVFRNSMQRLDSNCDNVNFHVSPMSMFNGDLLLVSPGGNGGIYILLGDFTGHGLSAAIGCLPVTNIFYAMTEKQRCVGDIAREINLRLQDLLPMNMFFCAVIMEISSNGDRLTIWSGGMNDMLLVWPGQGVIDRFCSMHMPLGILDDEEFESGVVVANPPADSVLLAYTDGVIEAQSPEGELFGEERLEQVVNVANGEVDRYTDLIAAEISAFQAGEKQSDDIAIVELRCGPIHHDGVDDSIRLAELARTLAEEKYALPPFRFEWQLDVQAMQRDNAVTQIVGVLSSVSAVKAYGDVIYTLLSEMYSNALEHGVLGLDSVLKRSPDGFDAYYEQRRLALRDLSEGHIHIAVELKGGDRQYLWVTITDSGAGFNYQHCAAENEDSDDSYGRGLALIQSLVEVCEYSQNGKTLTVGYPL